LIDPVDDFCSPADFDQKMLLTEKKSARGRKKDVHGLKGMYGSKKRKVTPGRVFGGKRINPDLARMSEVEVMNNPEMSLNKLRMEMMSQ
jgi:hypothetical protein